MKPATAIQVVKRDIAPRTLSLAFVAVFAFAAGLLVGDWTAEPRFAEREASILKAIRKARQNADAARQDIQDSIRDGCYSFLKRRTM